MTIDQKMKYRDKKRIPVAEAIGTGVLLGLLIIFFSPRCQPPPDKVVIDYSTNVEIPELTEVINKLSQEGYAIENHFPVYIRVYKRSIEGDEKEDALRIAKMVKDYTGTSVQIQLDYDGGRCFAHPDKGIIVPVVK